MRILWVIPSFQHPTVRGPSRHYHLLRQLAPRHEVTLATLRRSPVDGAALAEVRALVRELVLVDAPLGGGRIRQYVRLRRGIARLRRRVRRAAPGHDVILFHGKPVLGVLDGLDELPLAADFCDATSARLRARLRTVRGPERALVAFRWARTRAVERRLLRRTRHVAFISARDRDAVVGPGAAAPVVPNGVDLAYWTRRGPAAERPCIAFTGVLDYPPNDDAARLLVERVVPLVRRRVPGLETLVVGRSPTPALLEAAARTPGVEVTGFVDDLRPYLERAAVFAAPVRVASGMQNKALEALALEVPVVTTAAVAEGLRGGDGGPAPLVVAPEEPEAFADAVVALLGDAEARRRLARAGRRFVEESFDWERSAAALERLCEAAVAGQRGARGWQPLRA